MSGYAFLSTFFSAIGEQIHRIAGNTKWSRADAGRCAMLKASCHLIFIIFIVRIRFLAEGVVCHRREKSEVVVRSLMFLLFVQASSPDKGESSTKRCSFSFSGLLMNHPMSRSVFSRL